ncbi:MAG: Gfo/Idh/MocA family protein [Eubacteriales bacterium]|jgi:predicted dehydrogenase
MGKIRIGLIGCGIIGESHLACYRDQTPDAEVVAVCEILPDRLKDVADRFNIKKRYTNIGNMLANPDIDLIDICLHNNWHAPVAIAAMEAGKDVYCEKPMAGSYFDAKAMYDCSVRTGRKLHIQLAQIYANEAKAAKRFIDAGMLGEIYHMRSYGFRRRGRPYVDGYARKEFVNSKTAGGGALFDMGVYHISQLLWLTGIPKLERVCGRTYAKLPMDEKRREISGYDVEELGTGYATYEGGLTMDILESWAIYARPFPSSIICGSKGGLSISPLTFHSAMEDIQSDTTFDLSQFDYLNHTVYPEMAMYDNSQVHLVAALQGKCDLLPTREIGLQTQLVQEGIYISTRLGREVTSEEIAKYSVSTALEVPNLIADGKE